MESIAEIRKLLDRFYLGETTLEEEQILQKYFSSASVPEELMPDRNLFRSLGIPGVPVLVREAFNKRILNAFASRGRK